MIIGLSSYSGPLVGSGNTPSKAPLTARMEANHPGSPPEDPLLKRLHEQQEGLRRLQAMPSPKESARQAEMDKVGLLKQRLESLKAMLLYASPKQLKAIAEEIKAIAKELTSIARNLGSGNSDNGGSDGGGRLAVHGGSGTHVALLTTPEADPSGAVSPHAVQGLEDEANAAADAAHATASQAEAEVAEPNAALPPPGTDHESNQRAGDASGNASVNDNALRALLKDARKALEEVVSQLKSKLAEADKEARRDVVEAEKSLGKLNDALARASGDNVYTSIGSLLALSTDTTVSLPVIDISV